jgi:subfamily B ATP-binding cassette protein MsbA
MIEFLQRVLRLTKPYKTRFVLGVLFGFLGGLIEPLMVVTVAVVYALVFQDLDSVITFLGRTSSLSKKILAHFPEAKVQLSSAAAFWVVMAIPTVFMVRGVVSYLNIYLLQWTSIRAVTDLRTRLFSHLLHMPASFFAGSRSAELMSRVIVDTEALRGTISTSITTLIKDPVTLISTLAVLFWTQPKLTSVSMLVLPLCIVPIAVYGRKGRKAAASIQQLSADLNHSMLESFTGNRIIKAYNLEDRVVQDFHNAAAKFTGVFMRMIRSLETPGPLLEFAGSVGVALLLIYALRSPGDKPTGMNFLLLVLSIINMYRPMKSVVRLHATLEQARAASERVFQLLDTKSSLPEPANPKPLKAAGADIHFENINFSYDKKPILQDFNLTVKSGKLYALVGPSGSGKTTVTNLLLRFYDPNSGAVRIGDTDVREVRSRDLRDKIAVVTQETILFHDSIRNNIAQGRPGATEAEIIAAAKHASAHDFIMEKPQGYDTHIGERGIALSGGQRQRVAIARAILRDAPILILDEATSALDNEAERVVQAALEELMVGRTTICIAHRLSTIQRADVIVAMHEGRIVEMGSHNELLEKKGLYYNLHQLSATA